jgi:GcrA cell cycle regulator
MSSVEWTPERIKVLIALWEEGLPTSEIGRRLGVTKNAVVGKVHRLGLKKRQSPIRQSVTTSAQPKKPKKVVAPTPVVTATLPSGDVVRLEELTAAMCCWPEGEPGTPEFHFCGKSAVQDKPYCEEHCARAYVKVSKDKKRAASGFQPPKASNDTEAA